MASGPLASVAGVGARFTELIVDAADPERLARFWALALGYKLQDPPPGFVTWPDFLTSIGVPESDWNSRSALVDPDGIGSRVFFQRVPESKTAKNRVHLDLASSSLEQQAAIVDRLVAAGATRVDIGQGDVPWAVLADPEGNEFCVLTPRAD